MPRGAYHGGAYHGGAHHWRAAVAALAWLLPVSLLGGCGLLSKPAPLSADAPETMTIGSQAFTQGVIPAKFTCHAHGGGVSPPIYWSGMPVGTKSLALVVDDSDAPISPWVYWLVFDISPSTTDLQPGAIPPQARLAQNSARKAAYEALCPQRASHKYRFTIYALNTFFGNSLPQGAQLLQAWTLIAKHVIARGTTTYTALP